MVSGVFNKRKLYWSCQIAGWGLFAVTTLVFNLIQGNELTSALVLGVVLLLALNLLLSHLYRNFIVAQKWLRLVIDKLVPKIFIASVVMGLLYFTTQLAVSVVAGFFTPEKDFAPLNLLGLIGQGFLLYLLWGIIYIGYHYMVSYNQNLRYEAAIHEFQLNTLKSQLNPHFIFNALNSIRALVTEDPKKAKMAITQLSNIMRNSLIRDKERLINFDEEVEMVRSYLSLEGIRYEERLRVEWDLQHESSSFRVPPLMMQTLVENGIKHGISKLQEGGLIQIKSQVQQNFLTIQIRNSGQYLNGHAPRKGDHTGYGIDNTKQRLKLLYGKEATFSIDNENTHTVLTQVVVPKYI